MSFLFGMSMEPDSKTVERVDVTELSGLDGPPLNVPVNSMVLTSLIEDDGGAEDLLRVGQGGRKRCRGAASRYDDGQARDDGEQRQ